MKAASFDYVRAESKREVLQLLHEHGEDARVLAGGQSLMATLNMRLTQPKVVIDINRVEELNRIRNDNCNGDGDEPVTNRQARLCCVVP